MEQPEFRYDEFGFRVDKEGETEPLGGILPPSLLGSTSSVADDTMVASGSGCFAPMF